MLMVVLVLIARVTTPESGVAAVDVLPARPHPETGKLTETDAALIGELEGREFTVRVYAGDPLRYTVLEKSGRVLCRMERAEVVIDRFPEISLPNLLSEQAPALMRVDPATVDYRR